MKNYLAPSMEMLLLDGVDVILASQLLEGFIKPEDFDGGDPSVGNW